MAASPQVTLPISSKKTRTASRRMMCTSRDGATVSAGALLATEHQRVVILTNVITGTIIITPEPFTRDFTIPVIIMLPVTPSGRGTIHLHATGIRPTAIVITTLPGPGDTDTKAVDLKSAAEIITSANHGVEATRAGVATKVVDTKAEVKKGVATEVVSITGFVNALKM